MGITLIGDIHGDFTTLRTAAAEAPAEDLVLQVGDCGVFWPGTSWIPVARTVHFIDGNHEIFPRLRVDAAAPYEVAEGLVYCPRGSVLEWHGRRVGVLGGGTSVDRAFRTEGRSWWPDENITEVQVQRCVTQGPYDLVVTHTPPQEAIVARFPDRTILRHFGYSDDWIDPNAVAIQRAWDALGRPPLYCGHMHRTETYENVHMLNISEVRRVE